MDMMVATGVLGGLVWLHRRGLPVARRLGRAGAPVGLGLAVGIWALSLLPPGASVFTRLFSIHEAGHLALRLLAPLLFVLAWPFPALIAGLPRGWRRGLRRMRAAGLLGGLLAGLPMALALLIAWFYLWHLPALQEAARARPLLLLGVHLGMAASGVNFLARVLDRRGDPQAMTQARRLLAVTVVILSNILLGSLITLKEVVLYPGYAGGISGESIGGYTIWVPSSMVMIVVILLLFGRWNAAEERRWQNRHLAGGPNFAALEFPETAEELRLKTAAPNLSFARLLGVTALAIFLTVFSTVAVIVALG
ncbi:MAG TPA: cytochrome c oxidase assembly protein [Aliiroseovarius sp.]|nr:cytochrome c oxidase assembly protein [Aliiroseovarius sp.]